MIMLASACWLDLWRHGPKPVQHRLIEGSRTLVPQSNMLSNVLQQLCISFGTSLKASTILLLQSRSLEAAAAWPAGTTSLAASRGWGYPW